MNYPVLALLAVAIVLAAGCTTTQAPPATTIATPVPPTTTVPTPTPQPSFAIGDHYLQNQYNFAGPKDMYTEQFVVDSPSWAIRYDVSPKSDNIASTWFLLNVTNINTGHVDTFGYGGSFPYEKSQQFPMYKEGPYRFDMRGNLVTVIVTAAKRLP